MSCALLWVRYLALSCALLCVRYLAVSCALPLVEACLCMSSELCVRCVAVPESPGLMCSIRRRRACAVACAQQAIMIIQGTSRGNSCGIIAIHYGTTDHLLAGLAQWTLTLIHSKNNTAESRAPAQYLAPLSCGRAGFRNGNLMLKYYLKIQTNV